MASKEISFRKDAWENIIQGVTTLSKAVKVTLGPKGRHVMINKSFGAPTVTKDGVTVAKEIELKDKFQNLGAQIVKEAASKTAEEAGDGTTTATVLAEAIFKEGAKIVSAGANPVDIQRGIKLGEKAVRSAIREMSIGLDSENQAMVEMVATISANNDKKIGSILAKAFHEVSADGVISIEEGKGLETDMNHQSGYIFDRGYISPHFITNSQKMLVELEDCNILFFEKKISNMNDILPIVEQIYEKGEALLIIAEDIEGDARNL